MFFKKHLDFKDLLGKALYNFHDQKWCKLKKRY